MSDKITSAFNQVICILEEVKQEFHAEIENLQLGQAELRAEIEALRANQQEVQAVQQVEIKPKKKLKKLIIIEEKESYTADEISLLNDYELCAEFGRIKLNGNSAMYCGHCKKETPFDNWVHSIRKRCMKQGLSRETKIPKTCDRQQAVNALCNPINNRVYSILRSPNTSDKKKRRYLEAKQICFEKIGKEINPYKY